MSLQLGYIVARLCIFRGSISPGRSDGCMIVITNQTTAAISSSINSVKAAVVMCRTE